MSLYLNLCVFILGDLAPKYRDLLLSAFLMGARDTDPLVRASSVSNLGEICSVLRFNLGSIIQEVQHYTFYLTWLEVDSCKFAHLRQMVTIRIVFSVYHIWGMLNVQFQLNWLTYSCLKIIMLKLNMMYWYFL